ncbi:MAG: zf-HC2 domain-containing protein [Polyangia bacterium]
MSSEPSMHDKVDAFADGELPADEAEAFRAHLADCAGCQAELRDIMMLAAVTQPLAAAPIIPIASRRRRVFFAVGAALTAAAAIVVIWKMARPEPIVLAQADKRPLEARLSYGAADRWRPYDLERAGGTAREEVRVDTLARLESRGDWRGLADGYLLGGEPERAAEALAKAGESADVESDRAALALQQHDAAAALAHATRALSLAPGHAQAAWNRALALRELGLVHAAARAFEALAHKGEKGWSDEAKARAAKLRAADAERERGWNEADAAGEKLLATGEAPPAELVRAHRGMMQHYVERALREQKDPRKLRPIVPVAEAIDAELATRVRAAADGHAPKTPGERALDPWERVAVSLDLATRLAHANERAKAQALALEALKGAREADVDPRDLPRRLYVLLAEIARAQNQTALADAYVDEARLLMP